MSPRPVKALLISGAYFPPQVGGISRFMAEVASALGPDHVCSLTGVATSGTTNHSRGPAVYRYPSIVGPSRMTKAAGWAAALLQIMIRERPQVVILASVDDSHFGLWLHRWFRMPFIVFAYGNEILETINEGHQRQQLALRVANRVLATSKYSAGVAEEAGAKPGRIEVLFPGCDIDFFRPMRSRKDLREKLLGARHNHRVILTVGNLVSRKGHDMVIRALPDLFRRVPDLVYLIAGDGPYRGELEALARDLGVFDRLAFVGRVPEADLPDLYALCDVFVMVSRARVEENDVEGFGMVLLEANACGKPVVGGRSGGMSDALVEGVTGLLVDPLDLEDITEALARLLTDQDLATRFGEEGRLRVVRDFQWPQIGRRLLSILNAVQREGPKKISE